MAGPVPQPADAPRERPLTYPGTWPEHDVLVTDAAEWPIRSLPHRRAGHAEVVRPDAPPRSPRALTDVLLALDSAPTSRRVPVLAIGSNASTAQLRHKAREQQVRLVLPMLRARVSGLAVVQASFVSSLGYVPATVALAPGHEQDLFVQFLDEQALVALDNTEVGYRRVFLPGDRFPATLRSGETLGGVYVYVADGGYLLDAHGAAVRQGAAGGQAAVLDEVRGASRELGDLLGPSPDEAVRRARAGGRVFVDRSRALLEAAGRVGGRDEFASFPDESGAPRRLYGRLPSVNALGVPALEPTTATATGTGNELHRRGEPIVQVSPERYRALGSPRRVCVTGAVLGRTEEGGRLGVVAAVEPTTSPVVGGLDADPDAVGIDEIVRIALGVDVGDLVDLRPVTIDRSRLADRVFGPPNHVLARVTLSEVSTAERDVCLLPALSLELIGAESGDFVVVEGFPGDDGRVPRLEIRAFAVPDDVAAARAEVTGGAWGSRFPSARDALGVHPDLPSIWLDASLRERLGLSGQQLATVRVRAAREQQAWKEMRELLLVLAIALVGLVGAFDLAGWGAAVVAVVFLVPLVIVGQRLRRRISHQNAT